MKKTVGSTGACFTKSKVHFFSGVLTYFSFFKFE